MVETPTRPATPTSSPALAHERYASDDVAIEAATAEVDCAAGGAWVLARVWVPEDVIDTVGGL